MKRRSARVVAGLALLASLWLSASACAQTSDEQRRLAQFVQLSQQITASTDPEKQIVLVRQAQTLVASIKAWPANLPPRDLIETDLHALLGHAYLRLPTGNAADNLEQAIRHLEAAGAASRRKAQPAAWAIGQMALAAAYTRRVQGVRADNVEAAVRAAQAALAVLTPQANLQEWTIAQLSLAEALIGRERGDRAENLEAALRSCNGVLSILKVEVAPVLWIRAERTRAIAYYNRIEGVRSENLEKTIAHGEAALAAATRINDVFEAALAQNTLGAAYIDRAAGNRSDNIERAIVVNLQAARVLTRETWPFLWAAIQNNLGLDYVARIAGSRIDNVELAIAAFEAALTVTTVEAFPREWAETQHNLAQAYFWRTAGNVEDNQDKAIAMMEGILPVWQRNGMTLLWARSLNNLAIAYQFRRRGDRAENIERAIQANQAALTARPRDRMPLEWAESQGNLANVYMMRVAGDRADNIERSIAAHEAILPVYKDAGLWREWASTQNNLASAFVYRPRGDRAGNLQRSAQAYQASLTIRTPEALPRDSIGTARLLGEVHLERRDWQAASDAFAQGRRAFLILFGQGLQEAEARNAVAQAGSLFAGAAYAAAQRNDLPAALALASEGRARLLATSLRLQGLGLSAEKRARLDKLRDDIKRQEQAYEAANGPAKASALQQLVALRGQLIEVVQSVGDGAGAKEDVVASTLRHVPEGGALVVPIVTAAGGKLLVLVPGAAGAKLTAVDMPQMTTVAVNRLVRGDSGKGGWLGAFDIQYLPEAERAARTPEWLSAIEGIGASLGQMFGGRIEDALTAQGLQPGARVIWLPAGALGLLPTGLSQNPAGGRRLSDVFELVAMPSLEALEQSSRQAKDSLDISLAAAINPTGEIAELDLPFTEVEGALVARHFGGRPQTILDKTNASPGAILAALKGKSYWHFSSHGAFDWVDARQAGLIMRGNTPLTIEALLAQEGRLGRPRLVALSACETGVYDTGNNPEEFVGLPATFLQLGATGVVATLWQVDDLATALLMVKFYDLHMAEKLAPPTALRRAQAWLREATREELIAYAKAAAAAAKLEGGKLAQLENSLATLQRAGSGRFGATWSRLQTRSGGGGSPAESVQGQAVRPFAHPYYWGGFVFTGL